MEFAPVYFSITMSRLHDVLKLYTDHSRNCRIVNSLWYWQKQYCLYEIRYVTKFHAFLHSYNGPTTNAAKLQDGDIQIRHVIGGCDWSTTPTNKTSSNTIVHLYQAFRHYRLDPKTLHRDNNLAVIQNNCAFKREFNYSHHAWSWAIHRSKRSRRTIDQKKQSITQRKIQRWKMLNAISYN